MTATPRRTDRRPPRHRQTRRRGPVAVTLLAVVALVAALVMAPEPRAEASTTWVRADARLLSNVVIGPSGTRVVTLPVPAGTEAVKLSVSGQLAWRSTKVSVCPGTRTTTACLRAPALSVPARRAVNTHVTVDVRGAGGKVVLHSSDASVSVSVRLVAYAGAAALPTPSATARPTTTARPTATPSPTPTRAPAPTPTPTRTPTPSPTAAPTPAPSPTRTVAPSPSPTAAPAPGGVPGPSTTGVPAGTKLTVHEGDLRITEPGTVIDAMEIRGMVRVEAPDVVIRRTVVSGRPIDSSLGLVMVLGAGKNLRIEDSELYARHPSPDVRGIIGSSFTLTRVEIRDVTDQVMITGSDVLVQDSWLHSNLYYAQDPNFGGGPTHDDNVQIAVGSNIRILRNVLEDTHNASVMVTQDRGPVTGLQVVGNRIGEGGCSVNLAEKSYGPLEGARLTDNVFTRTQVHRGCAVIADPTTIPLLRLGANTWSDGAAVQVTPRG